MRARKGGLGGNDESLVWGLHAVAGMVRDAPRQVACLHLAHDRAGGEVAAIGDMAGRAGLDVRRCDTATLDEMTGGGRHQGAVARMAPFAYAELEDVAASGDCLVALDCVQDPRNLGAILRTAAAVNVGGLLLPKDRAVGVTGAALRSSGGYAHRVRIARVTNLARAIDDLKTDGRWAVGLVPGASRPIFQATLTGRVLLVVGGEGKGIRPLVAAGCDELVSLPMAEGVRSLNAAVAASVALYEVCRQRQAADVATGVRRSAAGSRPGSGPRGITVG
jgi:23S rRNA (guanosine2251-2'-O)-methyltransferase